MKTLIDIDKALLDEAMDLAQTRTKKETIQQALQEFIKLKLRKRLKHLKGSGITRWTLGELKRSRLKRAKVHKSILKDL